MNVSVEILAAAIDMFYGGAGMIRRKVRTWGKKNNGYLNLNGLFAKSPARYCKDCDKRNKCLKGFKEVHPFALACEKILVGPSSDFE